jgi:hypothetical protein
MRKAVTEIITKLKKLPEPGKKTGSFWDFMRSQLREEGEWDQKHIKVIEKEIDSFLTKLDKKSLIDMWKATPQGEEKYDDEEKVDVKEMKADISDEMIGQVMDRMDENYSSRDSYLPPQNEAYAVDSSKEKGDGDSADEDAEPDMLSDDEIDLEDDDLFNSDIDEEEDEYKF